MAEIPKPFYDPTLRLQSKAAEAIAMVANKLSFYLVAKKYKLLPGLEMLIKPRFLSRLKNKRMKAFNDQGKQNILTQAPTVQRASQRLILAIAPSIITINQPQ